MTQVYELSYEQHLQLANRNEVNCVVAGYTSSKIEADAFVKAHNGNQVQLITLSEEDMWMVEA